MNKASHFDTLFPFNLLNMASYENRTIVFIYSFFIELIFSHTESRTTNTRSDMKQYYAQTNVHLHNWPISIFSKYHIEEDFIIIER